jgi:hypothetical protein
MAELIWKHQAEIDRLKQQLQEAMASASR